MTSTNDDTLNYQRIEHAIRYLEENFQRQPELNEVAENVHVSEFHFQRLFTAWAGISPKRFLQFLSVEFLKGKLQESKNLTEAAEAAGLSSQSRVYDLFTTLEGVTPQEYKLHGAGMRIEYGFHDTCFGHCLIGVTERGVCWLTFIPTDGDSMIELNKMKAYWHNSYFHQNQDVTQSFVTRIFNREQLGTQQKLNVFVKGTNFQVKVWEALLKIPTGHVATYKDVALSVQSPLAQQAVGSAVGANHIAYLIPCHRVIRKDGILGEYRWSAIRKKSIIGWEMAKDFKV